MSVGEICNRDVVIVGKDSSALEGAELMREYHVGDLVVVEDRDAGRAPVGILTDRDIVMEVVAEEVDPASITVQDIMSFELVTASEEDDILETVKLMRTKGVRRVPVVDYDGELVGILAVDDLIDVLAETLTDVDKLIDREQKHERQVHGDKLRKE